MRSWLLALKNAEKWASSTCYYFYMLLSVNINRGIFGIMDQTLGFLDTSITLMCYVLLLLLCLLSMMLYEKIIIIDGSVVFIIYFI